MAWTAGHLPFVLAGLALPALGLGVKTASALDSQRIVFWSDGVGVRTLLVWSDEEFQMGYTSRLRFRKPREGSSLRLCSHLVPPLLRIQDIPRGYQ